MDCASCNAKLDSANSYIAITEFPKQHALGGNVVVVCSWLCAYDHCDAKVEAEITAATAER